MNDIARAGLDADLRGLPDRERIAKLVGMLGSSSVGERGNALLALGKALDSAGLSYGWLSKLVAVGEMPGGPRDALFRKLVVRVLRQGLVAAWAMPSGSAELVRLVISSWESGKPVEVSMIERALEIAADATRKAR